MHEDQLTISAEAVRRLIREQFPRWAGCRIKKLETEGTVNAIFRLGSTLVARFRLRVDHPATVRSALEREAAALTELAEHVSAAVASPVAIGRPSADFPLPWSILTWLPGTTATTEDPGASLAFARDLAALVSEVRSIDTKGRTFTGSGRGGRLADHDEWMNTCFAASEKLLDVSALRSLWLRYRELPAHTSEVMAHGDLIPGNVLVQEGRLAGILDCGGLGPADPSLDLVAAWHLLESEPREALRAELRCTDLEWERGKAWAFQQAMGLVWYYLESNPVMSSLGRRSLDRLLAAEAVRQQSRLGSRDCP